MLLLSRGSTPSITPHDALVPSLLDALPAPTAILDGSGRILHCNAAWRTLAERTTTFGDLGTLVTPADHQGTSYLRRLAALEGPLAASAHRLAREAQEVLAGRLAGSTVEYRRRRPEGEDSVEAHVAPLPSSSGSLAILQHLESTDKERAADAQAAALQYGLAVEVERAKRRALLKGLEGLGRDLHTPITPVRLELHLLATGALGPLTPQQERALEVISRNVQRWSDGEQAFIDLSTREWPPASTISLSELAETAAERNQQAAMTQGVRLVRPRGKAALPVRASPELVGDVIELFIRRAITASSSGSTVAVEVGKQADEAFVEVRDSGAGASPRELRDCFEPWGGRRMDPQSPDAFELAYARSAIQSAGGRVYAESDGPGSGLLLGLAFPVAPSAAPRSA